MDSLRQVVSVLQQADRVAILSHILPDGDCVGSMLALGTSLRQLGKEIILVNSDPIPEYLNFLPGAESVLLPEKVTDWPPLVVCVDCSDLTRLGENLVHLVQAKKLINIDHHISNTGFAAINIVEPNAAATGEIIAELIELLGVPLTSDLASQIYTAIVTDTGSFQYSNTSAKVHRLTAKLLETGLDASRINQQIYETKSLASVKLLGKALDSLEITPDGKLAWIALSKQVMDRLGAKVEHTEGIINFTRTIDSVEVGLLFREVTADRVKVGFRSKQLVDVNKLAALFGGGGHYRAAGCICEGKLEEIVTKVVKTAREFMANERHN